MDFKLVGGLTLEEALHMAYNDDVPVDKIYIEPPDGVLTDEDSGEEDGGGLVDNLSKNQLTAQAEVVVCCRDDDMDQVIQKDVENEVLNARNFSLAEAPYKVDLTNCKWIRGDIVKDNQSFPQPSYEQFKTLTPTEIFELFFDDDLINLLITETERYSQQKNFPDLKLTREEMRVFLAILILSGYHSLPGKKMFWDSGADMGNNLVKETMRRDRFLIIFRYLHCADNNCLEPSDKFAKLRPLIANLQKKFMFHFVPEEDLCYDESMVKYYGKHSCKQFIRGKPIRFGYKVWSLNTKTGYLVNFMVYQGADPNIDPTYHPLFGKAASPFICMLNKLPEEKRKLRYSLYFDNLFTGFSLLNHLKQMGYSATGTVRDNRIPKSCPLVPKSDMKKRKRGEFDAIIEKENGILLVRWADNSIVTVASTSYGVTPLNPVKRYSQSEKKIIQIERPHVIAKYNSAMGGTDLMDENISRFRIGLRGKKWWWCLFTWLIDATLQNCWHLYKKSGNHVTQLQFKRDIVTTYLSKVRNPPRPGGRPSASISSRSFSRVSDNIRFDNTGHLLTNIPDRKKKRCAGENCTSIMRTMCIKCDVGLCLNCNVNFHTNI